MNNKKRIEFNAHLNEEDLAVIEKLRDNYAINISGAFKIWIRKLLKQLEEKIDYNTKI